jgi:hypothetical protein
MLTAHLPQVSRLKMRADVRPPPSMVSIVWCPIKHVDNFIVTLHTYAINFTLF